MKNHIYTAILAIVITLFAIHAYNFYQLRKMVMQHEVVITQIMNLIINANQQKSPEPVQKTP